MYTGKLKAVQLAPAKTILGKECQCKCGYMCVCYFAESQNRSEAECASFSSSTVPSNSSR